MKVVYYPELVGPQRYRIIRQVTLEGQSPVRTTHLDFLTDPGMAEHMACLKNISQ